MRGFSSKFVVWTVVGIVAFAGSVNSVAQGKAPKTFFYDSDGNSISNNEFVDIRLANIHYPDKTRMTTLADGTLEFRLQKVPQEGMQAPEFSVKTLEGNTVSSSDLRGKIVVLNFWFIGCAVCRAQKPKLNELKAKFASHNDVVFVAMTADPTGDVKKYLAKEPFDFLQAADAKTAMDAFRFSGFPKSIVIGKNGRIVYWRGPVAAWKKFESVIRSELAQ
jgi:peroxiredoxin